MANRWIQLVAGLKRCSVEEAVQFAQQVQSLAHYSFDADVGYAAIARGMDAMRHGPYTLQNVAEAASNLCRFGDKLFRTPANKNPRHRNYPLASRPDFPEVSPSRAQPKLVSQNSGAKPLSPETLPRRRNERRKPGHSGARVKRKTAAPAQVAKRPPKGGPASKGRVRKHVEKTWDIERAALIPHHCEFCGEILDEMEEKPRKPGCCIRCYMERFATKKEKAEYERANREEAELEDDSVDLVYRNPELRGRVDWDQLPDCFRGVITQKKWEE